MGVSRIFFDEDCALCLRFQKAVKSLDVHGKIEFIPIEEANSLGLLDGVPENRRFRSFHLVLADGRTRSGAEAIPGLIDVLYARGLASKVVFGFPGCFRMVSWVYTVFLRLHDSGHCSSAAGSPTWGSLDGRLTHWLE
jgi:predicted DCC family thiol-disulfide oxidoreductase YuxK